MTLNDLQTAYTANYVTLVRMAMACTPKQWGYDRREEATQEILACTWRALQRRYVLGHVNDETFWHEVKSILHYEVKHVLGGRMMPENVEYGGQQGKHRKDVYDRSMVININVSMDAMTTDSTSIPDAVAFKIDFRGVIDTLTDRDKDIIACMIAGLTGNELAERFGLTAGRISQLRVKYKLIIDTYFDL